ncbi:RagB/SusD family nutrient uptake outer membrane protein [Rasiella sp. SM2506]|uniref:RagB/SusD family nutrient uptake outer membrane protein n=1 Tax=Rasiella sp. SM2506 TaxID=3423914 RepID=UPI003D7A8120
MKKQIYKILFFTAVVGTLFSCDVEEFSDLNNPEVDAFGENLTRGDLQDLIGGIFYSSRATLGTYYDDCGVIGREYWRFSSSDPRFTSDLLGGENAILDNNTFYITNPWASRYRTVKNANLILGFLEGQDVSAQFSDAEVNATKGFLQTFIAHELLLNLNLTYENGIRTDVADADNLGPIVANTQALANIRAILESGANNLGNGGAAFPFPVTSGFTGFDTPSSFLSANQALAARVAAYQGDMAAARSFLAGSFLSLDGAALNTGIYHTFSLAAQDLPNPMFFPMNATTAGARIMEPSFLTDAEANDTRLSKVSERDDEITLDGLTGNFDVFIYPSQEAPIAIIRNEELILLYAEANISSNPGEAVNALNIIRDAAGLDPYTGGTDTASLTDEMLNQRRYSLYAEGHRWIDMRRYGRLDQLPLARPEDDVFTQFPVPLTEGN